jgi:hypothetical protein
MDGRDEADEELADRLAAVADELRRRLRDDPLADVHPWLYTQVAGPREWAALACMLGAAVNGEADMRELWAWFTGDDTDRISGTRPRRHL